MDELNELLRECLKAIDKAIESSEEAKQALLKVIEANDNNI